MNKKFKLDHIKTKNKPGTLVNINIKKINNLLKINFNPNKIFYINDLNSLKPRGNHANCNAQEILICLQGSFEIKLFDGKKEEKYTIKKNSGIYIPKNVWLDFYNFKNCVILVFVEIDINIQKESIYDINEFKKYIYINNINE